MDAARRNPAIVCNVRHSAIVVACLTSLAGSVAAQATSDSAKLQPGAIEALRRMGAYLRTLRQFRVSGQTARDEVLRDGQTVQIDGTLNYVVRPPDRFRGEINTDRKQRQIFFDGKTLTVYAPRMHYYASVAAPNTIGATIDSARARYGIDFPIADLFLWGTPRDGVKDLTAAQYIGPAHVGTTDTDQYAFRQRGVDWQLWIARGNSPLPIKLVITTTSETTRPSYAASLSWDLSTPIADSMFAFVPPRDASRITLASYGVAKATKPGRH